MERYQGYNPALQLTDARRLTDEQMCQEDSLWDELAHSVEAGERTEEEAYEVFMAWRQSDA